MFLESTRKILKFFKALYYRINMPFDLDGSPNVSNMSDRTDQEGRSHHAIFFLAVHLLKSPDSISVHDFVIWIAKQFYLQSVLLCKFLMAC